MPKLPVHLRQYDDIFFEIFRASDTSVLDVIDEGIHEKFYYNVIDELEYDDACAAAESAYPHNKEKNQSLRVRQKYFFLYGFYVYLPDITRQILRVRYEHVPMHSFEALGRDLGISGDQYKYQLYKIFAHYDRWLSVGDSALFPDEESVDGVWAEIEKSGDEELEFKIEEKCFQYSSVRQARKEVNEMLHTAADKTLYRSIRIEIEHYDKDVIECMKRSCYVDEEYLFFNSPGFLKFARSLLAKKRR